MASEKKLSALTLLDGLPMADTLDSCADCLQRIPYSAPAYWTPRSEYGSALVNHRPMNDIAHGTSGPS
jgi:hypothetical protein